MRWPKLSMSKQEALAAGYTNHGAYYGIPIWIDMDDPACPAVQCKYVLMDWLFDIAGVLEAAFRSLTCPNEPYGFTFFVGESIKNG